MTLHNAHAVFHPVATSAAIAAATLVLLGVLFALAYLHTGPRDKAEEVQATRSRREILADLTRQAVDGGFYDKPAEWFEAEGDA